MCCGHLLLSDPSSSAMRRDGVCKQNRVPRISACFTAKSVGKRKLSNGEDDFIILIDDYSTSIGNSKEFIREKLDFPKTGLSSNQSWHSHQFW